MSTELLAHEPVDQNSEDIEQSRACDPTGAAFQSLSDAYLHRVVDGFDEILTYPTNDEARKVGNACLHGATERAYVST